MRKLLKMSLGLGKLLVGLVILLPTAAAGIVINNGLAPPNPENVITGFGSSLDVRNRGCPPSTGLECPIPLAPSTVRLESPLSGDVDVFDSSRVEVFGGEPTFSFVRASDYSRVHFESVTLRQRGQVIARDNSLITIVDAVLEAQMGASDKGRLQAEGSTLSSVGARDDAYVSVDSCILTENVSAADAALVQLNNVRTESDSLIRMVATGTSRIDLAGTDWQLNGAPIPYGLVASPTGLLSGVNADGDRMEFLIQHNGATPFSTGRIVLVFLPVPPIDGDRDGTPSFYDNCPAVANPGQEDTDLDGAGDACNDFIDSDGDEYADDRDSCPAVFNPEHRDTDASGIGDLCNDAFDRDGDEFEDENDNCADVSNGAQLDRDWDSRGDACDEFPDDRLNLGAQLRLEEVRAELAAAEAARELAEAGLTAARDELHLAEDELAMCLEDPRLRDSDGDGISDGTDQCADTPTGVQVGAFGCSLDQFCGAVALPPQGGALQCSRARWTGASRPGAACHFSRVQQRCEPIRSLWWRPWKSRR